MVKSSASKVKVFVLASLMVLTFIAIGPAGPVY